MVANENEDNFTKTRPEHGKPGTHICGALEF